MPIILSDFISLDGVVQAPGGAEEDTDDGFAHGGWSMPFFDVEVMGAAIDRISRGTDALVYGRRTWQAMAGAWPDRAGTDPFADWINAAPKHVASRSLTPDDLHWSNSHLLPADDALGAIATLREDAVVQVWGSANLAAQLVAADLVDEYALMVEPILLGGGKSIFPTDGAARPLELVSLEQAGTGVLVCRYRTVRG